LSNLDAKLREQMRLELHDVVERLKVTALFVTHEQIEALTMSDKIGVMKDGEIIQEGSPTNIYRRPTGKFVADFVGKTNMLSGKLVAPNQIKTAIGILHCHSVAEAAVGDTVALTVRPENILIAETPPIEGANIVTGRVEVVIYLGNMLECTVMVASEPIRVQLHPLNKLERGASVHLRLPAEHCLIMRG
jgi:iron(III) transport system ATP-binding protein